MLNLGASVEVGMCNLYMLVYPHAQSLVAEYNGLRRISVNEWDRSAALT